MQTSLAALYKGSGFVLGQMREGKGRGEGSREGEGSSRAGKRKRVEKKNVCAHREAAWLQRHRCLHYFLIKGSVLVRYCSHFLPEPP